MVDRVAVRQKFRLAGVGLVAAGLALACSDTPPTGTSPAYTLGGSVSGLAGSGLVLRANGGDDLSVTANGSFTFATPVSGGAAFDVTVLTQPSSPAQTCVVTGGSGTMASANVTSVAIACVTQTRTVHGMASGLVGSGLVLRNNGGDFLRVTANGSFAFAIPVPIGASYNVTVVTQPTGPAQVCVVTNGTGTVATANITNVAIACTVHDTFTVGGTVTGLVYGPGLVLRNNGGDDFGVTANGSFAFTTPLYTGAAYDVTVFAQPAIPPQTCVVTDGKGKMAAANVTTVAVTCVPNASSGTIRVTVATTGTDVPPSYSFELDQGGSFPLYSGSVFSNGTEMLAVAPGTYRVALRVNTNCQVTNSNSVSATVAAGALTDVAFSVTCAAVPPVPPGTIQVTVATTGTDAPASYTIHAADDWLGNYYHTSIPSNGTASLLVKPASYWVSLRQVPLNCTLQGNGSNPRWTVEPGATTSITFSVTCEPPATLRVTAATTGPNAPATYTVGVDSTNSGYSWYYKYSKGVSSNGTVSKILPSGSHTVKLVVPLNCFADPNPVSVTLTPGATTDLAFTVVCY